MHVLSLGPGDEMRLNERCYARFNAIYLINSGFVFVVCLSRTIFGNRKGAHVHLASWKHGNRDTGLNMVCTQ